METINVLQDKIEDHVALRHDNDKSTPSEADTASQTLQLSGSFHFVSSDYDHLSPTALVCYLL